MDKMRSCPPTSGSVTENLLIQLDQPPCSPQLALKNRRFFSKIKILLDEQNFRNFSGEDK